MKILTVKKRQPGGTTRKVLRWDSDEVDLRWKDLLLKVGAAFTLNESSIRLSLDHGKTFIKAEEGTLLSTIGIVNGDILTMEAISHMQCTPQQTDNVESADTEHNSETPVSHEMSTPLPEQGAINRFLMLPMLLRDVVDGNLPANLEQLLRENEGCSPLDQLILSLHVLFIESGFLYTSDVTMSILNQIRLPSNTYKITYSHVCHEQAKATIACVPMGSQLAVHAVVMPKGNMSLILQAKRFIDNDKLLVKKLAQLSAHVKDLLITPLILLIKEGLNIDALPPVLDLPHEITLMLLAKLDYKAVCRMGSTCKTLSWVYKDNCLWRKLYLRKYPEYNHIKGSLPEKFWYNEYKKRTLARRRPPLRIYPLLPFPDISTFVRPHVYFPPPIRDDPANEGIIPQHTYPSFRQDRADILNALSRQLYQRQRLL